MASLSVEKQQVEKKLTPAQKKQQELFKEMAAQLSQDFDKKLDDRLGRFESLLTAMANPGTSEHDQPPAKKKQAQSSENDSQMIITQADVHPQPAQVKQPVTITSNLLNTDNVNPSAQPSSCPPIVQTPEVTSAIQPPLVNNNIAASTWLLDQTKQQYGDKISHPLPTSVHELTGDFEVEEQDQQILASATHQLAQGAGKPGLFPHKYVYKGPERRRVGLNTLSVQEHVTGIFLIIDDPKVSNDIKPHLLNHIQEVLDDACHFDWPNAVRRWSEEVFSAIAENRLKGGWKAHNTIQMMRMSMSRAYAARIPAKDPPKETVQRSRPFQNSQLQETQETRWAALLQLQQSSRLSSSVWTFCKW